MIDPLALEDLSTCVIHRLSGSSLAWLFFSSSTSGMVHLDTKSAITRAFMEGQGWNTGLNLESSRAHLATLPDVLGLCRAILSSWSIRMTMM